MFSKKKKESMNIFRKKKKESIYKKVFSYAIQISVIAFIVSAVSAMAVIGSALVWSKQYNLNNDIFSE